MSNGERFYEVRARFDTLDGALEWAHTLDANGVREVIVDNGEGYGLRGCAADGCGAVLAYPDEGDRCEDHRCNYCGAIAEYLADNNESGILSAYCGKCEERRAEKYGCAMILAEGAQCEDGVCGCGGEGVY